MSQDAEALGAPTFASPPNARDYVHAVCGSTTTVDGFHLELACDPFLLATTARCAACNRSDDLAQFAWADSGENIVSYRERLRRLTPPHVAMWRGPLKLILMIGLTMLGLFAGVPFVTYRSIAGPVVGTVVGFVASIVVLVALKRKHRIDYRVYR